MKALSIRQPWAWACVHARKPIENRSRADKKLPSVCRHRGPLLIHASKNVGRCEFDDAVEGLLEIAVSRDLIRNELADFFVATRGIHHGEGFWAPKPSLVLGGIVGLCTVIGHVDPSRRLWLDPAQTETDEELRDSLDWRWAVAGSYGLVLADPRPLPFIPFKGSLGLFEVPDEIVARSLEAA